MKDREPLLTTYYDHEQVLNAIAPDTFDQYSIGRFRLKVLVGDVETELWRSHWYTLRRNNYAAAQHQLQLAVDWYAGR